MKSLNTDWRLLWVLSEYELSIYATYLTDHDFTLANHKWHFVKSDCLRLEKIETSYCNSENCETIRFVSFFLYPWVVSLRPLIYLTIA